MKQAAGGPLPLDALGIGLVVLTSFMWASSLVAGRFGVLAGMPPLTLATFRVFVAFLLLFMVVLATSRSLALPRKLWAPLTLMSITHTGLSYGLSFLAVQTIPAGVGMVVMATQPFWVALIGHYALRDERVTRRRALGLLVGFAGVVTILAERLSLSGDWIGLAFIVGAALVWSVGTVLARKIEWGVDSLTLSATHFIPTGIFLALLAALVEGVSPPQVSLSSSLVVLYLAVVPTAATTVLIFYLLRRHGTARVTPFVFLQPPFAMLQAALVLGEGITLAMVVGTLLVGAGIIWVTRERPRTVGGLPGALPPTR